MLPVLIAMLAANLQAPEDCIWMNTATASGILGGTASYTSKPQACEWTRSSAHKESLLKIEVIQLSSIAADYAKLRARCTGPATALDQLGNEAIACASGHSQMIAGRVRDQGFAITISGEDAKQASDGVRRAAEQVAGNLF